jgi:hypothetical protein
MINGSKDLIFLSFLLFLKLLMVSLGSTSLGWVAWVWPSMGLHKKYHKGNSDAAFLGVAYPALMWPALFRRGRPGHSLPSNMD